MSESVDLRGLLEAWPFDPEDNVRLVRGDDGREILQVRLPAGVEQYELDGRPDGQRPHGMASLLDYHLQRLEQARAGGRAELFELTAEECAGLFAEGTLYYFRYLNLCRARDWRRTLRDTTRNLRLFDFVRRHAAREEDRLHLEKWRPYILRMKALAAAMLAVEANRHEQALAILRAARDQIEALEELDDETFHFERDRSLLALRELAAQIEQARPVPESERLERELRAAIERQEFERAAQLRDRLRALRAKGPPGA